MLLVLQVDDVEFFLRLFELVFEPGDLFLVGGLALLNLYLEEG